ncbi:hypothetical protein BZG36_05269, partial [Bifiguratus adelaidae]
MSLDIFYDNLQRPPDLNTSHSGSTSSASPSSLTETADDDFSLDQYLEDHHDLNHPLFLDPKLETIDSNDSYPAIQGHNFVTSPPISPHQALFGQFTKQPEVPFSAPPTPRRSLNAYMHSDEMLNRKLTDQVQPVPTSLNEQKGGLWKGVSNLLA